jgi:murein lipoprotein
MRKLLIPLLSIGLLVMGGCTGTAAVKPEAQPAGAAKPAITPEAQAALDKAEADVKQAKAQDALWTTAQDALNKAREAAAKGDSGAVVKFSKTASEHARLGLEQKGYPLTK